MSEVDWGTVFEWSTLLKCFVVGGLICVIGQILIDKTKLTPARILVIFVTLGAILGGLGIYQYLVDFAGAGATVPLTGFGYNLAKGAIEEVKNIGFIGAFTGGVKAAAGRNCRCHFLWLFSCFDFKAKNEKTIIIFIYENEPKLLSFGLIIWVHFTFYSLFFFLSIDIFISIISKSSKCNN